jgi:hypothetical protein
MPWEDMEYVPYILVAYAAIEILVFVGKLGARRSSK